MGATCCAYELARQFGLKVVEPRPARVPLTLGGDETLFRSISGVAGEVIACAGKAVFREAALFTHKGLSGPAILQVRSEEHTSELQSLMRISYAVFCLKKKKQYNSKAHNENNNE